MELARRARKARSRVRALIGVGFVNLPAEIIRERPGLDAFDHGNGDLLRKPLYQAG